MQLLSATKSRKKQQAEAVQSVIHAEAEKRRKERENFHITTVPILVRAAHEPSLYNGTSEEHEDDEVNQDQEKVRRVDDMLKKNFLEKKKYKKAFLFMIIVLDDKWNDAL